MNSLPFIARDREAAQLLACARAGKPALVCGPSGIGKTFLLRHLQMTLELGGVRVVSVRLVQPFHKFLQQLAGSLALPVTAASSSVTLRGLLWKVFERAPHIILLDDIEEASLPVYRFFEQVLPHQGACLIGASREPHTVGALRRVFWNQQTIFPLRPLPKQAAAVLLQQALLTYAPASASLPGLSEQILKASRGFPGRLIEMCRRLENPAYRDGNRIHWAALTIDSLTRLVS